MTYVTHICLQYTEVQGQYVDGQYGGAGARAERPPVANFLVNTYYGNDNGLTYW